jgi:hypothetical protein
MKKTPQKDHYNNDSWVPVFEKSFVMFKSLFGTWIPFGLIFLSTYLTGKMVKGKVV